MAVAPLVKVKFKVPVAAPIFVTDSAVAEPTVGAAVEEVVAAGAYPNTPVPIALIPATRV